MGSFVHIKWIGEGYNEQYKWDLDFRMILLSRVVVGYSFSIFFDSISLTQLLGEDFFYLMVSFGYSGFILHYSALSDKKKSQKYIEIQLHKTHRSLHKMKCKDQICQRSRSPTHTETHSNVYTYYKALYPLHKGG